MAKRKKSVKSQPMRAADAAKNSLIVTKDATIGEKAIVFCDFEKKELGEMFADACLSIGLWTRLYILESGKEARKILEDRVKETITSSRPDIFINIFRNRADETPYRIQFMRLEQRVSSRIVHCPGISLDMFTEGAAALTVEEYENMFAFGNKLKDGLKGVHKVHVTCPRGSDFTLDLGGKDFQVEHGTNIPTGEINVMPPIGDSFKGKLVSTSGGTGKLYRETPAEIISKDGLAGEVRCKDVNVKDNILKDLDMDPGARYLGEFAIGINPKARIVDAFIEAEKVVGTIHIAFGGSYKPSKTHLDLLIENPSITAFQENGDSIIVMENGKFKI